MDRRVVAGAGAREHAGRGAMAVATVTRQQAAMMEVMGRDGRNWVVPLCAIGSWKSTNRRW